jgi:hypothetical protein
MDELLYEYACHEGTMRFQMLRARMRSAGGEETMTGKVVGTVDGSACTHEPLRPTTPLARTGRTAGKASDRKLGGQSHTWIHLEIKNPKGEAEVWAVEGGTPNVLLRRGLRRDCLLPGTEIIVDGYHAKDHTIKRANGKDITFTDGSKIFLGSSGTGAPYDADAAKTAPAGRC